MFVSLKHSGGLVELIKSHLHNCLDLFWMNGEVKVHWDVWKSVLEHWQLIECKHGNDVVGMWVIMVSHVYLELWNDVTKFDSVYVDIHGDVSANVLHGTNVNLLFSQDQIFPDVEVLIDNKLLVLLPSEEKGVEIGIASSVFGLNIIPPSPDIMVIPFEGDVGWLTSTDFLLLCKSLHW